MAQFDLTDFEWSVIQPLSRNRLRLRGAAVSNLAHAASFHSAEKIAPSDSGNKHLKHRVGDGVHWRTADARLAEPSEKRRQREAAERGKLFDVIRQSMNGKTDTFLLKSASVACGA